MPKLTHFLGIVLLSAILIPSCQSPEKKAEDTKTTSKQQKLLSEIPGTDADKMMSLYQKYPVMRAKETNRSGTERPGAIIEDSWGYTLSAEDFEGIKKVAQGGVYIGIGIKNFAASKEIADSVAAGKPSPAIYTLIVVPLDANGKKIVSSTSATGDYVAYEFLCPCVNGKGCCL